MKSLRTLLRIAKRDLETLRRALAEQIARQTQIEGDILALARSVTDEQGRAAHDFESARLYGAFAAHAVLRRRALEAELITVIQIDDKLRDMINDAHVEMRKFERLLELEAAREKAKREKREAAELDEYATLTAGRAR